MCLLFQPGACFGMVRSHHSLVAKRRRIGWTRQADVAIARCAGFLPPRRLGLEGLGLMTWAGNRPGPPQSRQSRARDAAAL